LFSGTRVNSWLDDEGNVVKEESPAGFIFIREPEFKATELAESSSELLSAVAVKIKGEMVDLAGREEMKYRLTLPTDTEFDKLTSSRQRFEGDVLTVSLETLPEPGEQAPPCEDSDQLMISTPYIQSDADSIIDKSREITGAITDDREKVEALAKWVYETLEKRPVLGIPDALTTLATLRGDCNEHASLFAALARAAGIPTKMAAGVVFHKGAFYYHAWNEVCLSGRWISLDTTTMQFPADLSHIKFVEGELQEQVRIGALLNTLQIEPIP
jgi:transglutaminase-like putative cysteine protease